MGLFNICLCVCCKLIGILHCFDDDQGFYPKIGWNTRYRKLIARPRVQSILIVSHFSNFKCVLCTVQTFKQLAQPYEMRQKFPELTCKLDIFLKPKPSQDAIKPRLETSWLQFFIGRYPNTPYESPSTHYSTWPCRLLFKSQQWLCPCRSSRSEGTTLPAFRFNLSTATPPACERQIDVQMDGQAGQYHARCIVNFMLTILWHKSVSSDWNCFEWRQTNRTGANSSIDIIRISIRAPTVGLIQVTSSFNFNYSLIRSRFAIGLSRHWTTTEPVVLDGPEALFQELTEQGKTKQAITRCTVHEQPNFIKIHLERFELCCIQTNIQTQKHTDQNIVPIL